VTPITAVNEGVKQTENKEHASYLLHSFLQGIQEIREKATELTFLNVIQEKKRKEKKRANETKHLPKSLVL